MKPVVSRFEDLMDEVLGLSEQHPAVAVLSVLQFAVEEPIFRERFTLEDIVEINHGIDLLNEAYRRMCRVNGWHFIDSLATSIRGANFLAIPSIPTSRATTVWPHCWPPASPHYLAHNANPIPPHLILSACNLQRCTACAPVEHSSPYEGIPMSHSASSTGLKPKHILGQRMAYTFSGFGQAAFYNMMSTYFVVYVTSALFAGVDKTSRPSSLALSPEPS